MEGKITLDYSFTFPFISEEKIANYKDDVLDAMKTLYDGTGPGSEYRGWLELPDKMLSSSEFQDVLDVGSEIYENADLLVCVGIGGSYLGAKALSKAMLPPFHNLAPKEERSGPKILFAGQNISGLWLKGILDAIERNESVYINIISKSGTTTEPGIAFRTIKGLMEKKYGKINAAKRIIATTDATKGALKKLATNESYRTFVIPDDVGGRYSVLSPVGLVPLAGVGIDITKLLQGALEASRFGKEKDYLTNPALTYAMIRNLLLKDGYTTEIMVNYQPTLHFISEWWKQLYGESEGKEGKGIFPASVDFTADLHSMGQWIQDGPRFIFETCIKLGKPLSELTIDSDSDNLDGLEYLAGKCYCDVNRQAQLGTLIAHYEGDVPNMEFIMPEMNEYYMGQLVYIFEQACGISGYLLGVNPFDQPGVESYKNNMFALLNKPGEKHEKNRAVLDEKMTHLPSGKVTR